MPRSWKNNGSTAKLFRLLISGAAGKKPRFIAFTRRGKKTLIALDFRLLRPERSIYGGAI